MQDAFYADLLGCLAGLKTTTDMGIAQIIIEIDALLMKAALETDDYKLSSMGITETKHVVVAYFIECRLSVCPQLCNRDAHELASIGYKCSSGFLTAWDFVPQFVEGLVSNDCVVTMSNEKHPYKKWEPQMNYKEIMN